MKVVRNFSRILIAPVFIFSGFVKAIDPLGSAYKFSDYFEAFGMDFMAPIALGLAILLSTAELVIGLSILMGITMRVSAWALLLFMSFFTVLTFIMALTNPVTDCGCFGDAIILSNWQTFWKNIVFMIPTLFIFYGRKRFRPLGTMAAEWGILTIFVLTGIVLSVYTYRNLPVFDFRPYKVGTHIPSAMSIPEDAEVDEYETYFIYEKDGEEQQFSVENIPYEDTTWKYVDRKTKLIKKGYEPPIHDFTIVEPDYGDITDSVLINQNYSLLIIAYDLGKSDRKGLEKVNAVAESLKDKGVSVYGLTASTSGVVSNFDKKYNFNFNFHTSDEVTLKTIVRSNPGIVLLKDGVIMNKWHFNNLPKPDKFSGGVLPVAMNYHLILKKRTAIGFYLLLLVSMLTILLLLIRHGE